MRSLQETFWRLPLPFRRPTKKPVFRQKCRGICLHHKSYGFPTNFIEPNFLVYVNIKGKCIALTLRVGTMHFPFKASGGCYEFGKECFVQVQAQSQIRTQLCRGIIDLFIFRLQEEALIHHPFLPLHHEPQ